MLIKVRKSKIAGEAKIPGSKSHTIRALFISSLANGRSFIKSPLFSDDATSAINVCRAFGAKIEEENDMLIVDGFGSIPKTPENIVDVGNSGTTLRIGLLTAALSEGYTVFTGDGQIRERLLAALIDSANDLGATVFSTRNNGKAPVVVKGRAVGGSTKIDAFTSQYLTSLLINAPLMDKQTRIEVTRLNEIPYVEMTMWWLDKQGIKYTHENLKYFEIEGRQTYKPIDISIPGDFSSGTFFAVLAAISGSEIKLRNLDMSDTQGDKAIFSILSEMGAKVTYEKDYILVKGQGLKGIHIDMNSIPDALPALAVAGCFAEGETRLLNVRQARYKETDRIAVMCKELKKMGADIEELEDGLIIRNSKLTGTRLSGHGDHRIVMSLAIAALSADKESEIDTAEAMNITFPEFASLIKNLGGEIEFVDEQGV